MDLNYGLDYRYYKSSEGRRTHRAEQIGDLYYKYDGNGNVTRERAGGHRSENSSEASYSYDNGVYGMDYGFALSRPGSGNGSASYERTFTWDYKNQLIMTKDNKYTVKYRYGADGQRAVKYTEGTREETLYFNTMWQMSAEGETRWLQSKHIFVGETRIATKSNYQEAGGSTEDNSGFETLHQYWYHGDQLGSAQVVTTNQGNLHERIEYTPYGELWVEHRYNTGEGSLPYRFTGKELDRETNLYYYGARYLDPKTSRWMSADPAMGEYIPGTPLNDEAVQRNRNLPGGGGIYNPVNLHVFHYAGNNPVKYTDPDGRILKYPKLLGLEDANGNAYFLPMNYKSSTERVTYDQIGLPKTGPCNMRALIGIAETFAGKNFTEDRLKNFLQKIMTDVSLVDKDDDYEVKNDVGLVSVTMNELLGAGTSEKYIITITRPGNKNYQNAKEIAMFSLLAVGRRDDSLRPGHWQEGDSNGNFVWDPLSGNDSGGRKIFKEDTRYITITPGVE
jgi:RHS repeat-associated protein